MTNACKFKEVFGIKPDIAVMMLECPPRGEGCQWRHDDACHCDDWWIAEYKERKQESVIDKISEEIMEKAKEMHRQAFVNGYKDMYLNGVSAAFIACSEIIAKYRSEGTNL